MKTALYIVLFLGGGINFGFSQTDFEKLFGLTEFDSNEHDRIYRLQIEDYQVVELIEFKNNTFKGALTHMVWKINRKEIQKDIIRQKIAIPNPTVKNLVRELKVNGVENLRDCADIENCVQGLDGTTTIFESININGINTASYWELESDYYYNQNEIKLPAEIIKARKLTSIINKEFDLEEQFQNFLNRLPNGRYSYSMLILKKG